MAVQSENERVKLKLKFKRLCFFDNDHAITSKDLLRIRLCLINSSRKRDINVHCRTNEV